MSMLGPETPAEIAHRENVTATTQRAGRPHWANGHSQPDAEATETTAERLRALELGESHHVHRLDTVEPVEPAALLVGRLAPMGHTILFGDGDVGKGTLACQWTLNAIEDGHVVLILDYEDHGDEWTWRLDGLAGSDGRSSVWHVSPAVAGWQGPLWDNVERIRELVALTHSDIIVIDSITVACASFDVLDNQSAGLYATAIQRIGVPVLSIAHVTKAGTVKWPFGSIFWHNLARVTWNLSAVKGGRLLACKKSNAYRKPPMQLVTITWDGTRLREVWERPYADALQASAFEILEDGPTKLGPLVERINEDREEGQAEVKADRVRQILQRAKKKGLVVLEGGEWRR